MAVDEATSTVNQIELLAGVVMAIDGNDTLFDKVVIKEISGNEEDILAERKSQVSDKITRVLASCITEAHGPKDAVLMEKQKIVNLVRKMTIGDRIFLFIQLRILSLGEQFTQEFEAPSGTKFKGVIDLNTLDLKKLENKLERTKVLTFGDTKILVKLATGEDEEALSVTDKDDKSRATKALIQRVVEIDGKKPTLTALKDLSLAVRNKLRNALEEFDAGVDTMVTATDPETQQDFDTELGIAQKGFFFP